MRIKINATLNSMTFFTVHGIDETILNSFLSD